MRTINFVIMIIGLIVLIAISLLSITTAVYPAWLLSTSDFMGGPLAVATEGVMGRMSALIIGLVILLGLVYLFFGNLHASRREKTVVLQNPTGEVLVSLPAIEDFARIVKGKIEGLRDIKGKVVFSRRGLKVSARISTFSDYNIAEVAENVQEAVRSYVQKTLNIEQEINPTVIVTKVVNRERPEEPSGIKTTLIRKKDDKENEGTTEISLKK